MDIPKDHSLYVLPPQPGGFQRVELLLLQRSEEALHACVAVTTTGTAHALHYPVAPEHLAVPPAGELTASI